MTEYFETPSDSIGIVESQAKVLTLSLFDQITPFADSSLIYDVTMEVWWGNIKWRTACHGGI